MELFYQAFTEGNEVTANVVCSNNDGEICLGIWHEIDF